MTDEPCMSCGQNVRERPPEGCLHKTNHVVGGVKHDTIAHVRAGGVGVTALDCPACFPPVQIPDEALRFVILGAFRAVTTFNSNFPIMVDHVEENFDNDQQVQSFTIVTASGLRFRVLVEMEQTDAT